MEPCVAPDVRAELEGIREQLVRAEIAAIREQLKAGRLRHYYTEAQPPEPVRALATSALEIAMRELGISGLQLKFFQRHYGWRWPHPPDFAFASDLNLLGAFQDTTIWIKADIYGTALVATVLHEARHAERNRTGVVAEGAEAEADAEHWATRLAPRVIDELRRQVETQRTCEQCRGILPPRPPGTRGRRRRYCVPCGPKASARNWRLQNRATYNAARRLAPHALSCRQCGVVVTTKRRTDAAYCSQDCRSKAKWSRERARREAAGIAVQRRTTSSSTAPTDYAPQI